MIASKTDWLTTRKQLVSLFEASYGKTIDLRYLDWRYFENNHGKLLFSFEQIDGNLISSYSAFPVELVQDGKKYDTATSMTTMTHPQWQGKGLFPKLATELYEHMAAYGFSAVWGFPNAKSHGVFNSKLAWSDIYEIPTLTLDLGALDSRRLSIAEIEIDDDFNLEYPTTSSDGFIRVLKSREYLEWRYRKHPTNRYTNFVLVRDGIVSSYVVTKVFGDAIDLVDIQVATHDEARGLLSQVLQNSLEQDVKQIHCWAPTHHFLHGVLEYLGFVNTAPITYFGGRKFNGAARTVGLLDYRKWYIQMGDSDVY